jgi:hypothetical protein
VAKPRVAPATELTNTAWRAICAAAERKPKAEAAARAALSKVLFKDYPGYAYNPAAAAEQAERMLQYLDAFAELYAKTNHISADDLKAILENRAEAFIPNRAEAFTPNDVENERALWWIARLRRRTETMLNTARNLQGVARTPRQTEQRAMLYHWLCGVWLDYFEGPELPPAGPACTPLVNFMLAAMRLVVPRHELPKPATVRANIERERGDRDPARLKARRAQLLRLWPDAGG